MRNVLDKSAEKIITFLLFYIGLFINHTIYVIKWKNTVHPSRSQMVIWSLKIPYLILKAISPHSEYVILIDFPL
jgi:hypothetical protein